MKNEILDMAIDFMIFITGFTWLIIIAEKLCAIIEEMMEVLIV